MPKFCTTCGNPLDGSTKFCTKCGAPVVAGDADTTIVQNPIAAEPTPATTAPVATPVPNPAPAATAAPAAAPAPEVAPAPETEKPGLSGGKIAAIAGGCVAAAVAVTLAICIFVLPANSSTSAKSETTQATTAKAAKKKKAKKAKEEEAETAEKTETATDDASKTTESTDDASKTTNVNVTVNNNGTAGTTTSTSTGTTTNTSTSSSSGYILPESSTRVYSVSELTSMGLSRSQLTLAKNEIYARHGRGFNTDWIRNYFQSQSWYTQTYSAEEGANGRDAQVLNSVETQNVANLKSAGSE